jgi:hypothetical protein
LKKEIRDSCTEDLTLNRSEKQDEEKKSSSRVECAACIFLYPCSVLSVPNHWAVVVTGQAENKLQVLSRSSSSSPHLLRFLSRIPTILLCLLLVLYLLVSSWLSIIRLMPVSYVRLLASLFCLTKHAISLFCPFILSVRLRQPVG